MKYIITTLLICVMTAAVGAQSLRELAKKSNGSATTIIGMDFGIEDWSAVTSQADLIVFGRIVQANVHLTADETAVVTDYVIAPVRILKQHDRLNSSKPGEVRPIVVRRVGGVMFEGNTRLSTTVNVYPEAEVFQVNEDVVIFLEYDTAAGVYQFAAGPYGAFRVANGRVRPMTQYVSNRRGDQPMALELFLVDCTA